MTSTPILGSNPQPDLAAIRLNAIDRFFLEPPEVLALLEYTEALIAALRELLSHVEDTGPPDYARLVEIRALLPQSRP